MGVMFYLHFSVIQSFLGHLEQHIVKTMFHLTGSQRLRELDCEGRSNSNGIRELEKNSVWPTLSETLSTIVAFFWC